MRPLIPFIFFFPLLTMTGCFPAREGGPDTAVRPDDGTVLVEHDAPVDDGDGADVPDLSDSSDLSDVSDPSGPSDGADVPDLSDDIVTDDTPVPDEDLPPVAVFFDDQVRARTIAELGRATERVRFVSYTFSDEGVLTTLNALHGKGVGVRGVTGAAVTAGTPLFPVRTYAESGDSGIVHAKFFVVDGATALLSSSNIAYQNIRNFLVVVRDDPALVAALEEEFRQLDEEGRGDAKARHCDPSCPTAHGELFFSPGPSCAAVEAMLGAIPADTVAWLIMYGITDNAPMFDELRGLTGRGALLHALFDDWTTGSTPANQEVFDDLTAAGADVAYYDGSMTLHHKFLVTPAIVEFGSMNWTYAGCLRNDEFFFISEEESLVQPFIDHAQGLFH